MRFVPGSIYHVYNRGNNRQKIFFSRENYLFFLKKIKKELIPYCRVLAWCLMPNHFHLMIYYPESSGEQMSDSWEPSNDFEAMQPLTRAVAILLSSYTKAINKQQQGTGSLFQQKTKAKLPTEDDAVSYPFVCFHYIHQNPLKAGLVEKLEDWEFSSFQDYVDLREGTLADKALAYKLINIPTNPAAFRKQSYQTLASDAIEHVL